jgi:hypothetical protein
VITTIHLLRRGLSIALLFSSGTSLFAQGALSVISTNDGNGQFSWIFSANGGSFPEVDQFKMKLYGVQDTFSPPGWAATIDADDFVTWNYLGSGGAPFNGSPMALAIHSISTQSILYGGIGNVTYPDGLYSGAVFGRFRYEGPIQIPEPSQGFLCVLAAFVLYAVRQKSWRRLAVGCIADSQSANQPKQQRLSLQSAF